MIKLGGLGTIFIIGFIVWSLLAPSKAMQLDRACRPTDWVGSLFVSMVAVAWYDGVESTARGFQKADYTCQYALWRLFYEKKYQQAVKDGRIDPKTGQATQRSTPAVRETEQGAAQAQQQQRQPRSGASSQPGDEVGTETSVGQPQNRRPFDYPLSRGG